MAGAQNICNLVTALIGMVFIATSFGLKYGWAYTSVSFTTSGSCSATLEIFIGIFETFSRFSIYGAASQCDEETIETVSTIDCNSQAGQDCDALTTATNALSSALALSAAYLLLSIIAMFCKESMLVTFALMCLSVGVLVSSFNACGSYQEFLNTINSTVNDSTGAEIGWEWTLISGFVLCIMTGVLATLSLFLHISNFFSIWRKSSEPRQSAQGNSAHSENPMVVKAIVV